MSIFFGYINVLCHDFTFHIPNIAFYYTCNLLPVALLYHFLYFTHPFTLQKEPFFYSRYDLHAFSVSIRFSFSCFHAMILFRSDFTPYIL